MFGTMARLIKPCSSSNWLAGDTRFRLTRGLAYDGALARTPAKRVRLAVDPGLASQGSRTRPISSLLFCCFSAVAPFRFPPTRRQVQGSTLCQAAGGRPWPIRKRHLGFALATALRFGKKKTSAIRPTLASRQCGQSSVSPTPPLLKPPRAGAEEGGPWQRVGPCICVHATNQSNHCIRPLHTHTHSTLAVVSECPKTERG